MQQALKQGRTLSLTAELFSCVELHLEKKKKEKNTTESCLLDLGILSLQAENTAND